MEEVVTVNDVEIGVHVKKVIPESVKNDVITVLEGLVRKHKLTIANIKEINEEVIEYMSNNATIQED